MYAHYTFKVNLFTHYRSISLKDQQTCTLYNVYVHDTTKHSGSPGPNLQELSDKLDLALVNFAAKPTEHQTRFVRS